MESWEANNKKGSCIIDCRSRQDIIRQIERLARSYVPEWKFSTNNPDAASVIGMIFANQTMESIKKLNQVLDKYHVEFANMYGVSLKPAIPAKSICTLQISEGMRSGAELKKGTQVMGVADNDEEIVFAFAHDIYAVNTKLTDILETSGREQMAVAYRGSFSELDYIDLQKHPVFDESNEVESFSMFSMQGRNIHRQAVIMYFSCFPDMQGQSLRLRFQGNLPDEQLADLFTDKGNFTLSYITEEGLKEFDSVKSEAGFVEIINSSNLPQVAYGEEKMTALVLELQHPVGETINLHKIELFMKSQQVRADFLCNGRNELSGEVFCPFTQQPALYNEFYIGHQFLFEQKGADLTLCFHLDFVRFSPQSLAIHEPDLRIIKRKQKRSYQEAHYECRIQEVTFDYFNGKGWKRLSASVDTTAIFSKEDHAGDYSINFTVPYDWESVIQGGYEGKCIRMQITRADNCYMQNVEYIYPVLSGLNLQMNEQINGIEPQRLLQIQGSKVEDVTSKIRHSEEFYAFRQLPYPGDYVYWGFDHPLGCGPFTVFVELEKALAFKEPEMVYSYSSSNGFKELKVIDYTDSFQNSGIIMFIPPADMAEYEVEGVRRYWIRIEDKKHCFATNRNYTPNVRKIHMNAVMVENVVEKEEQDYYMDAVTSNMRFSLNSDNILSVQVWVNEKEQLSEDEMNALLGDDSVGVKAEYNFLGGIEEFYVLWHEVDSFDNCGEMQRCYCVDRGKNELIFGDGINVKIPQCTDGIAFKSRVCCCDGEKANVRAESIDRFCSSVFSVEQVINPIDAYSGTNLEEMQDALKRGSNILSSRKRMITENDYVKETLAFSDMISQVSCVTGVTCSGNSDDSVISLVILMEDYKKGDYSFRNLKEPLKDYLMNRCEITCGISEIQIVEPIFVRISLDIWLNVPDLSKSLEIKHRWMNRIADFLEPVKTDSGSRIRIGKLLSVRQIRLMLSTLEDTADIVHMNVFAEYTFQHSHYRMSLDRIKENPFMICCNGRHNIYIDEIS